MYGRMLSCRVVEYIRFLALPPAAADILDGCHIVQFGSLRLKIYSISIRLNIVAHHKFTILSGMAIDTNSVFCQIKNSQTKNSRCRVILL